MQPTAWKKVQKNFRKHLVAKNKSLTFAPAFQTKAHKEEFFETIIDKQTSSTSLHVIIYNVYENRNRQL